MALPSNALPPSVATYNQSKPTSYTWKSAFKGWETATHRASLHVPWFNNLYKSTCPAEELETSAHSNPKHVAVRWEGVHRGKDIFCFGYMSLPGRDVKSLCISISYGLANSSRRKHISNCSAPNRRDSVWGCPLCLSCRVAEVPSQVWTSNKDHHIPVHKEKLIFTFLTAVLWDQHMKQQYSLLYTSWTFSLA